ncbi:MAG: phage terminase large subunit, partial [Methylocystis sp.]|nr:phage terminase large subunit [Methylocystis sp.]
IDDPLKDRLEADSPTKREQVWSWYNQALKTRLMSHRGWIVIIQTRWHEDDLVGRLTDPSNPSYSASEGKKWKIIDLPALAGDNDVLGRAPGEALWPERFPESYLHELREADPRGFQALYQGSPTPEKGNFFAADRIRTYNKPTDRPPDSELRFYAASDHAVSLKQDRDKSCFMVVGIDADDNIWVMDDIEWGRFETDVAVDKILRLLKKYRPLMWWAERGHISKSIGPFLRKRMHEERIYAAIDELVPVIDKKARAQSIAGRIHMGKVYFPSFAPWWMGARDEMLKFPYGAHDDFVDALAWIGLGLSIQHVAQRRKPKPEEPKGLTLGMIKKQTRDLENRKTGAIGEGF